MFKIFNLPNQHKQGLTRYRPITHDMTCFFLSVHDTVSYCPKGWRDDHGPTDVKEMVKPIFPGQSPKVEPLTGARRRRVQQGRTF